MQRDPGRREHRWSRLWTGLTHRAGDSSGDAAEWDSDSGFISRQLRLPLDWPAGTVAGGIIVLCLIATTAAWGVAGLLHAAALVAATLPLIVGYVCARAGVTLIHETYGSAGIAIFGTVLLLLGLAIAGVGVTMAIFPRVDDRLLEAFRG